MHNTIIILDFGSQYTQLIARRIREMNVYCEVHPYNKIPNFDENTKGVVLSGSPYSVLQDDAPMIDLQSIRGKLPLLGICYGAQLIAHTNGGKIEKSKIREYGKANLSNIDSNCELMHSISDNSQVWMSHADTIFEIPEEFKIIVSTNTVKIAGYSINNEKTYGIQFHPEVYHSVEGQKILSNFVFDICGCKSDWTPVSFIEESMQQLKTQIGSDSVILGLSGGVDSTVAAIILHKAIGKQLHCIFIDNGLLRKNEFESVLQAYNKIGLNVTAIDASEDFLGELKGVTDPEQKRKIIGRVFVETFDKASKQIPDARWLAQGTIYPDVIESISVKGPSATIKSHHNVGGLPEKMSLKIVEPLKSLFKDEVRRVGKALEIDENILNRHPFPGPGLGIRIIGEITKEKVKILQEADAIYVENLKKHNLYSEVWQAAAILLPVQTVGVMGDERTYESVLALRAVNSTDGMTADWCRLPYDFLAKVSNEIINNVRGINRVVYDISSKPPATIEWE